MTKEPKLERARRQVPEWESYDKEVAAFAARIFQLQKNLLTEFNSQISSITEESSESHQVTTTISDKSTSVTHIEL